MLSVGVGSELETNNVRLHSNVKRKIIKERYYILAIVQVFRNNTRFYATEKKINCPLF